MGGAIAAAQGKPNQASWARCRCDGGKPSFRADVAGVSPLSRGADVTNEPRFRHGAPAAPLLREGNASTVPQEKQRNLGAPARIVEQSHSQPAATMLLRQTLGHA